MYIMSVPSGLLTPSFWFTYPIPAWFVHPPHLDTTPGISAPLGYSRHLLWFTHPPSGCTHRFPLVYSPPPVYSVRIVSVADLGGREGCAPPPPGHPNSFDFMQFSGKFGKIVCWRPPWGVGAPPPPGKSWIRRCVSYMNSKEPLKELLLSI